MRGHSPLELIDVSSSGCHLSLYTSMLLCRDNPVNMVYRTPHIHLNGHNEVGI